MPKISALSAIAAAALTGAMLGVVVDTTDLTMAATGTTKKTTLADIRTKVLGGGTGFTASDPISAGAISPDTDNARTLGTGALRWSDFRAVTATFSGQVNLTAGPIQFGAAGAPSTGMVRLPNNTAIAWRNGADSANYQLFLSTSNILSTDATSLLASAGAVIAKGSFANAASIIAIAHDGTAGGTLNVYGNNAATQGSWTLTLRSSDNSLSTNAIISTATTTTIAGFVSVGAPGSTVGAVAGDLVIGNAKSLRASNAASSGTVVMVSVNASDRIVLGGNDLQWGTAQIALGGGAAPTLGTIGGSGPTAAAQSGWLKVFNSAGAARFLPIWA